MVNIYKINNEKIILKSDIAGEFPVYVYVSDDNQILLYGKDIIKLLDDERVKKPLKVSTEGLSFLLQSGVIPPPKSIYENIYILGIGNILKVETINNKLYLDFKYEFPFYNKNRFKKEEMVPCEDEILEIVAKATIDRIDTSMNSFLFHSAGKDSNTIAVALAGAGWQNKVSFITYKSKGQSDESEISKSIAEKLGFKHKVLYEIDNLNNEHIETINEYSKNIPFPCLDRVSLAYPLYAYQAPELKNSNIIDGMGNDVYMGHIPSKEEFKRQKISKYLGLTRLFSGMFKSESLLHVAGKTRAEWTGLSGMSYSDVINILPEAIDVHTFWKQKNSNIDYLDFRADVRGTIIDQEMFTRKVRNFSDVYNANMILPFANEKVAHYFSKIPEEYLFDKKLFKNKLIIRKILKKTIDLDSDKLGKMAFSYDTNSIVSNNWKIIRSEIIRCSFWSSNKIEKLLDRMKKTMNDQNWSAGASERLIYKLFLLSLWLNNNKYIK